MQNAPGNDIDLSIIIPCYNDGRYLAEAVESAFAQSWPGIEVIVVDDGSDDPETVQALQAVKRPGLTLLRLARGGVSRARNRAISLARGRYILPLDADDKLAPEYAALAVQSLDANPQLGLAYADGYFFGLTDSPATLPEFSLHRMLFDQNCLFNSSVFRKADWALCGGYDESLNYCEDYDLWVSILSLGRSVVKIPGNLHYHRVRESSVTGRMSKEQKYNAAKELFSYFLSKHQAFYLNNSKALHAAPLSPGDPCIAAAGYTASSTDTCRYYSVLMRVDLK